MSQAGERLEEHRLLLGAAAAPGTSILTGLPLLQGSGVEALFPRARPTESDGPFQLFEDDHFLLGLASCPIDGDLAGHRFRRSSPLREGGDPARLCRIWNYVPGINHTGADGLEHYRSFCKGRAQAFEQGLGRDYELRLPAASAVGTDSRQLTVLFAAALEDDGIHFENPLQIPAYHYPADYGPRSPSFARATLLRHPRSRELRHAFISGTAAIRGHRSLAAGDTPAQLAITLENLQALGQHCGLGEGLGADQAGTRHIKVYLRHEQDLAETRDTLERGFLKESDQVTYLRSDICRADLNVEIELSLLDLARSSAS